jgi:hypothetical protein
MAANAALAPGTPVAKNVPVLTMSGFWPYLPIVLMTIAAVIWIARGLTGGAGGPRPDTAPEGYAAPPREPFLTPYLKSFIVVGTMMVLINFAFTLMSHLFPAGK